MVIEDDETILNNFLQTKLKKINKKIKKNKKKFLNSLQFLDKTIALNNYKKLFKKTNCLINKLKFPIMKKNFNLSIMMNDDNNNTYFKSSLFISSSIESKNSNYNISKKGINDFFNNYINNPTPVEPDLLSLITIINNSNNTSWYDTPVLNGRAYGYKSGSTDNTATYRYTGGIEFTLNYNTTIPKFYSDTTGHYWGTCFNTGFDGNIIFNSIPDGIIFGIACVGKGGHTDAMIEYKHERGTDWHNYYCNGGGGGGIYYSTDLSKDKIAPEVGKTYKISVDAEALFGPISASPGQDGSSLVNNGGGSSGNAKVSGIITSNCFEGGNGGGGGGNKSNEPFNGTDSKLKNITIPYLNDLKIKTCGGGGGGGQYLPKVTIDNLFSTDTLQRENIYYANGGWGDGGVTYEHNNPTANPNGFSSPDGEKYGGGGGCNYIKLTYNGYTYNGGNYGNSVCFFWWYIP